MVKIHNKTFGVIAVLMMLTTSSLGVNYSYADNSENDPNIEKIPKSISQGTILTEKVVNGKLEVKRFALSEDITDTDMNQMIYFEGTISSWAYVNYKTYQSGIVLYDGKASKVGENLWKISANNLLEVEEQMHDLELDNEAKGTYVEMHGAVSDDELSYRIIFTGEIAGTNQEDVFAVAIMDSDLNNHETEQKIKLLQFGQHEIHSENESNSQELKNSFLVV